MYEKLFTEQEKQLEEQFFQFLRFPSISADSTFHKSLTDCAEWLEHYLKDSGFEVQLWNKEGVPVVFAEMCKKGKEFPTVLIYNHYDVQPVDPIELWKSDPFTPTREGNSIVARGAQDNKGQCFYVISALRALYKAHGEFPVNIKLIIEGEEESGSKSLPRILEEKKKELQADYVLVVDVGMQNATTPAITLGTRGIITSTIEVTCSHTDLHSGMQGGMVYNPLHALVEILASLRDQDGKVLIPDFYDKVTTPTEEELKAISFAFDENEFEKEFGCKPTGGEKSFKPLWRCWLRPTVEINGINGGYSGPGFKTVIPAKAVAKVSCRLVADQDPDSIGKKLQTFIESQQKPGFTVTCKVHDGNGKPIRTSPNSPLVKALADASEKVYRKKAANIYEGGSIPIITELAKAANGEVCFFGLGLASDKIHAPNENFGWDRIKNGFVIICDALTQLGNTK